MLIYANDIVSLLWFYRIRTSLNTISSIIQCISEVWAYVMRAKRVVKSSSIYTSHSIRSAPCFLIFK